MLNVFVEWLTVFLAALTVVTVNSCPQYIVPLNKTMQQLMMRGPLSWDAVDSECRQQFPGGFEMLNRDFIHMTEVDKALCHGRPVPLRLRQEALGSVVWPESVYLFEEEVNSTYWDHSFGERPQEKVSLVGSLDLSTGQWRLVANTTTFTCAICQRAWLSSPGKLRESPPVRPRPFKHAYTFLVSKTGNDSVSLCDAIVLAKKHLMKTLGRVAGQNVRVEINQVADSEPKGTLFRLKSSFVVRRHQVREALNRSYTVEAWLDKDRCPAESEQNINWRSSESGLEVAVLLHDFHYATRWCSWWTYPDGDWDAVWDDIVYWFKHGHACSSDGKSSLMYRLQEINEQDFDLKSLVHLTANLPSLHLKNGADNDAQYVRTKVSHAVVDALSSLLDNSVIGRHALSACEGQACAFLSLDFKNDKAPNTFLIPHNNALPQFLSYDEHAETALQTALISLQLPRAMTSGRRIAVHVIRSEFSDLFTLATYYLGYDYAILVHVVSSMSFDEFETEKSRPAVTFQVNNSLLSFLHRYHSVWSLGENDQSTLPCPWVGSEGSLDTFSCNKWTRGPQNFTTGTFLAFKLQSSSKFISRVGFERVLLGYATISLDETTLLIVATFINNYVDTLITKGYYIYPSVDVFNTIGDVLSGVVLTEPVFTASLDHVNVLVSDLSVSDPVIGFSFKRLASFYALQTITASSRVDARSEMDIVLGGDAKEHSQQLAILAVSDVADFQAKGVLHPFIKRKVMVVHAVVTLTNFTEDNLGNLYLEIRILGKKTAVDKTEKVRGMKANSTNSLSSVVKPKLRFHVATWSEKEGDWLVLNCAKLRSTRALKKVIRCKHLTFTDKQFSGRFLIFEPVGFADSLGMALRIFLTSAGIMSGVSLVSVAATAASLSTWRNDMGHKILLQMTLALSFNLALGFTSFLVSVDTASIACLAIGAFRHFSYLSMFAWMLVMSGLQLRRLLSMLGSKGTSYLHLKIAIFAWGVPAIIVGSLLIFKREMYMSDAWDRGYCYPEGDAFTWSVQAPAATVLAFNAIIFFVILTRLYGFWGWGETEDLRRHQDEHAFQMRRLRAVFYTFCLFGNTWLFHLMAEQGVFQVKCLYEYLFLITASVHVFSLSCIFVFFDPETRADWGHVIGPIKRRLGTWVAAKKG